MPEKQYWKRGERAKLADLVGVSQAYLSDVLHRRRGVGWAMASRLWAAASALFADSPGHMDWIRNKTSQHPAFFGEPEKQEGPELWRS